MKFDFFSGKDTRMTFQPLRQNTSTQVLIIGGGLCGLLLAYILNKNKIETLLAEKNIIASGKTRYLSGFMAKYNGPDADSMTEQQKSFSEIIHLQKQIGHHTPLTPIPLLQLIALKNLPDSDHPQPGCTILKNALVPSHKELRTNGILRKNGAAVLPAVPFCSDLAEYLSVQGVLLHEGTSMQPINEHTAVTEDGKKVRAQIIVDCTAQNTSDELFRKSFCITEFAAQPTTRFSVIKTGKHGYAIFPNADSIFFIEPIRAVSRIGIVPTNAKRQLIADLYQVKSHPVVRTRILQSGFAHKTGKDDLGIYHLTPPTENAILATESFTRNFAKRHLLPFL